MQGSIIISASLNDGKIINIRHIVTNESSGCLIGRNVTTKCDTIYSNGNYLKLTDRTKTPQKNVDMHSYLPSYVFLKGTNNSCSNYQVNYSLLLGTFIVPPISFTGQNLKTLLTKYESMFADMRD